MRGAILWGVHTGKPSQAFASAPFGSIHVPSTLSSFPHFHLLRGWAVSEWPSPSLYQRSALIHDRNGCPERNKNVHGILKLDSRPGNLAKPIWGIASFRSVFQSVRLLMRPGPNSTLACTVVFLEPNTLQVVWQVTHANTKLARPARESVSKNQSTRQQT